VCSGWEEIVRALGRYVEVAGAQGWAKLGAREAPSLRGFDGAPALLAFLHGRRGSDPERDGILAELVVAARTNDEPGGLAKALLWLAFWPALSALLGRTASRSTIAADELASELAEKFSVVIARCNPTRVTKVAATILLNTCRRFRGSVRDREEVLAVEVPLDETVHEVAIESQYAIASGADVIDALIDFDRQLGDDVDIVLGCVVEGLTTREAAQRRGIGREALKKRLQRATARLRASGQPTTGAGRVPDLGGRSPIHIRGRSEEEVDKAPGDDGDGASKGQRARRGREQGSRGTHGRGRRTNVRGCSRVREDDASALRPKWTDGRDQ
jgi:RNA polymerase sigma-70 factor (ECF subfamily)